PGPRPHSGNAQPCLNFPPGVASGQPNCGRFSMSSGITAVIIVVVIIIIAAIIAMAMAARRRRLQQQFGDEYDRTLAEKESRREAEAELSERQRRVRKYHIRPLSPEARSRYQGEWQAIQEQFVDSPQTAVAEAYNLVTIVMQERGYPSADD